MEDNPDLSSFRAAWQAEVGFSSLLLLFLLLLLLLLLIDTLDPLPPPSTLFTGIQLRGQPPPVAAAAQTEQAGAIDEALMLQLQGMELEDAGRLREGPDQTPNNRQTPWF